MNLLHALTQLLGAHQPAQINGMPPQPIDPNFAQHVADNQPVDPRYAAMHPANQLRAHQAAPQQLGNNTQAAQIYASNPTDPRVMHMDPAQFGYPADGLTAAPLRVGKSGNYSSVPLQLLLGASNMPQLPQGGQFNPGASPMQGGRNPQIRAFQDQPGQLAAPRFNPQAGQQSWNNY